jgi:flagellar basal-body rod protein FlgG
MNIPLITASTTLNQLQKKVDTISNNIANMNTTGYKRREATFQDVLTQTVKNQPHASKELGRQTPYGLRVGHGAILGQTTLNYAQGAVQQTGRPLDLMIEGESGWFRTLREWTDDEGNARSETNYTRSGAFHAQPDPVYNDLFRLVTAQGQPVLDEFDFPIVFDANFQNIEISSEGTIRVQYADDPNNPEEIQLSLARIHRPDLLEAMGENSFRLPTEITDDLENPAVTVVDLRELEANEQPFKVRQGALEASNVDLSQEMSELMVTQRLMQFQSRSISIADDMMGLANSLRG